MPDAIACPGCLKQFAWTPKVAGKRVTCHCGQKFITPDAPGGDVIPIYETQAADAVAQRQRPREFYDLATDEPADNTLATEPRARSAQHARATKCPDCNAPVKAEAIVCVRCGFDLSAGQKLRTDIQHDPGDPGDADDPLAEAQGNDELTRRAALAAEPAIPVRTKLEDALAADLAKAHRFREVTLPLALLILGVALFLFNAVFMAPWSEDAKMWGGVGGKWASVMWVLLQGQIVAISLVGVLVVIGRLLCAGLLGADFGTPLIALLKITAFTLAFTGLAFTSYYGLNVLLEGFFAFGIILWYSLAGAAFFVVAYAIWDDIDQVEMGLMLAVVAVGLMMAYFAIWPIIKSVLGYA